MPISKIGNKALGAGAVLQVVQAYKTNTFSTTATTADITGLSVTITPSSSTSKFLVMACVSNGGINEASFALYRNGTAIGLSDVSGSRGRSSFSTAYDDGFNYSSASAVAQYLDAPNTASEITYKVGVVNNSLGRTVKINHMEVHTDAGYAATTVSHITVMEIAG